MPKVNRFGDVSHAAESVSEAAPEDDVTEVVTSGPTSLADGSTAESLQNLGTLEDQIHAAESVEVLKVLWESWTTEEQKHLADLVAARVRELQG